jgi:hypothetical protein
MDVVFVLGTIAFFLIAAAYIAACEHLGRK